MNTLLIYIAIISTLCFAMLGFITLGTVLNNIRLRKQGNRMEQDVYDWRDKVLSKLNLILEKVNK